MTHHPHTHVCGTHFQAAAVTSARCELSLIRCHGDPCQACVTFGGQGHRVIPTHSCLHLFICLLVSLWFVERALTLSVFRPAFHT